MTKNFFVLTLLASSLLYSNTQAIPMENDLSITRSGKVQGARIFPSEYQEHREATQATNASLFDQVWVFVSNSNSGLRGTKEQIDDKIRVLHTYFINGAVDQVNDMLNDPCIRPFYTAYVEELSQLIENLVFNSLRVGGEQAGGFLARKFGLSEKVSNILLNIVQKELSPVGINVPIVTAAPRDRLKDVRTLLKCSFVGHLCNTYLPASARISLESIMELSEKFDCTDNPEVSILELEDQDSKIEAGIAIVNVASDAQRTISKLCGSSRETRNTIVTRHIPHIIRQCFGRVRESIDGAVGSIAFAEGLRQVSVRSKGIIRKHIIQTLIPQGEEDLQPNIKIDFILPKVPRGIKILILLLSDEKKKELENWLGKKIADLGRFTARGTVAAISNRTDSFHGYSIEELAQPDLRETPSMFIGRNIYCGAVTVYQHPYYAAAGVAGVLAALGYLYFF